MATSGYKWIQLVAGQHVSWCKRGLTAAYKCYPLVITLDYKLESTQRVQTILCVGWKIFFSGLHCMCVQSAPKVCVTPNKLYSVSTSCINLRIFTHADDSRGSIAFSDVCV